MRVFLFCFVCFVPDTISSSPLIGVQNFSRLFEVSHHKSKLLVSSKMKITVTRVNLLKANSPEVSRASPFIYTLDFPRKFMEKVYGHFA